MGDVLWLQPIGHLPFCVYDRIGNNPHSQGDTIGYTYDEANNLSTITTPEGLSEAYSYDGVQKLTDMITPLA